MCLNRLQLTQGDVENGDFSPEQKQQQDKDDEREDMGEGRVIETFLYRHRFIPRPPSKFISTLNYFHCYEINLGVSCNKAGTSDDATITCK